MNDDYNYNIGKTAADNTKLIQEAYDLDVWFHIKDVPSAHLIMSNPEGIDLKTLRKTGIIYKMALNLKKKSKYKKHMNITIIYDHCKNVSPLDKPGLVSCNSPKTIKA